MIPAVVFYGIVVVSLTWGCGKEGQQEGEVIAIKYKRTLKLLDTNGGLRQ